MILFKIIYESIVQAVQQLLANKLRSFLSLLGIVIGIWCIISVLAAVDSLQRNIMNSINKLGDDIIYVDKFSWAEDPNANYWKWMRRPDLSYKDYLAIAKKVKSADKSSFAALISVSPVEYGSTNVSNVPILALTYDYGQIFNLEFDQGRYFTNNEYQKGVNQCILGYVLSEKIFGPNVNPIGKKIKTEGRKLTVIGVLTKEGENLLSIMNFDEILLVGFNTARKVSKVDNLPRSFINVKAKDGVDLDDLQDEITGVMRAHRKLKPVEKDNFALNKLSIITNAFDQLFGLIGTIGWVIGFFSILVGGFGVANIMFVSVKERTNIIGIKKALGAKRYMILLEFLIEAIILCIIGGALGLALVKVAVAIASKAIDFQFYLSTGNIITGLTISIVIGIVAGFLPAAQASKMDPVDAIRA